jgi:hypothetical protein
MPRSAIQACAKVQKRDMIMNNPDLQVPKHFMHAPLRRNGMWTSDMSEGRWLKAVGGVVSNLVHHGGTEAQGFRDRW